MTEEPWYHDGLQFTCQQCGDCCTGDPGVVWVSEDETQAIADYLDKPVGEIRLFHTRIVSGRVSLTEYDNGDCTFFDPKGRGCTIYPVRPTQCRTWPFWNSLIDTPEAWEQTCRDCPGAGQGQHFTQLEVEKRAGQIDM